MKTFSWDISCYCDYKCEYCFFTEAGWDNMEKLHGKVKTPDAIDSAWRDVHGKYGPSRIKMTGGEPFSYPEFNEIVRRISRHHYVQITTNLSRVDGGAVKGMDPRKVTFNATYHPSKERIEDFKDKVMMLKKAGFICDVCYLAHPKQLREMVNYKRYLAQYGIIMSIVLYRGIFNGIRYPESYTIQEKINIEYAKMYTCKMESVTRSFKELECLVDVYRFADNEGPGTAGIKACSAGSSYASIALDGTVRRCGQTPDTLLGNLYEKNIVMREAPVACGRGTCGNDECSECNGYGMNNES
ncbi:MAG: radical SAM protein [Endomicrobiales bacterium]|nr:radical SAM protein [Endomicrobiales bacterium]